MAKCPHCGNGNPALIERNGPWNAFDTYLCIARVKVADSSFDRDLIDAEWIDAEGMTACGMQWDKPVRTLDGFTKEDLWYPGG